jgi:hypothetical protein
MWIYSQKTGRLFNPQKQLVGIGYAGHAEGLNNPEMQDHPSIGPLPCGMYTIGPMHNSERTGVDVMNLTPDADNEMFGRRDFEMHGDSKIHPHEASHGCIVQMHAVRLLVNSSEDRRLKVVPQ